MSPYLGMKSGSIVICGNPHNKLKGKKKTEKRKNSEETEQCILWGKINHTEIRKVIASMNLENNF